MTRKHRRAAGVSAAALAMLLFTGEAQAFAAAQKAPDQTVLVPGSKGVGTLQITNRPKETAAHTLVAMGLMTLRCLHKGTALVYAVSYDTRFGTNPTATAADGWVVLGQKPGTTDTYIDFTNGNNASSGNSYGATAKKDWADGWALWLTRLATQPGSRLFVAGGEGQTYNDPGTLSKWWSVGSHTGSTGSATSLAYPSAIITYDSRDPTNVNKYGRLTRGEAPILYYDTAGGGSCLNVWSGPSHGYAIVGLRVKPLDGTSTYHIDFLDRHDDVMFQNCIFDRGWLTRQNNSIDTSGACENWHVSKSAFYGSWDSGLHQGSGVLAGMHGIYCEDNVFIHCGWLLETDRTNSNSLTGAANFLSHGWYFPAGHSSNAVFRRNVWADSAQDGLNLRGPHTANTNVCIREPIAYSMLGYSGSLDEMPGGGVGTMQDLLVIDTKPMTTAPGGERSWGVQVGPAIGASALDNALFINNSQPSSALIQGSHQMDASNPYGFDTYVAFSRITSFGWAFVSGDQVQTVDGTNHYTYTNCKTDFLLSGTGNSTSSSSDFPSRKTNAQIYAMMLAEVGVSSASNEETDWAKMANLMAWDPTQPWAQRWVDKVFPLYNKTPTYPAAALSSMASETPYAVY